MTTLGNMIITEADVLTWFGKQEYSEGTPMIQITTIQEFGKKTVTGLHVGLIHRRESANCYIDQFSVSTTCLRVPLLKAMPVSRRGFMQNVIDSIESKLNSLTSKDHPYVIALQEYLLRVQGKAAKIAA